MNTTTQYDRRKAESRRKLLIGARTVMASKGIEQTTIRDIATAAHVATGSFYTHFDSKESILVAAVEETFQDFTEIIEENNSDINDPAERVARALSGLMRMATIDPLTSQFLVHAEIFNESIGVKSRLRLIKDLSDGVEQGCFHIANINTASHLVTGIFIGYLRGRFIEQIEDNEEENTIFFLLRSLGVQTERATELSQLYGSQID